MGILAETERQSPMSTLPMVKVVMLSAYCFADGGAGQLVCTCWAGVICCEGAGQLGCDDAPDEAPDEAP